MTTAGSKQLGAVPVQSGSVTPDTHARSLEILRQCLASDEFVTESFRDNTRVYLRADQLVLGLRTLKDKAGLNFLADLGGVDYLKYPGRKGTRFEVHYCLLSHDTHERLVVKVGIDDPEPALPTVTRLWGGANWMEREVFDMFGIRFEGHPDMRRILMPEEFTAFPLRKDYPLRGRGERHNFPRLTREES